MKSKYVKFGYLPRRLTMEHNPPIYTWLWFTFGILKNGVEQRISLFEKVK